MVLFLLFIIILERYNTPDTQTLLIVNEDEFPSGLWNHCVRKIGGLSILHQLYCAAKIKEEDVYKRQTWNRLEPF